METKRIYKEIRNLYNLQTEITSVSLHPTFAQDALVTLKETIFFPGGGGQSCDYGTIDLDGSLYEISETFEQDNEIYHRIKDGSSLMESGDLSKGKECHIEVNREHRFDNMQRHCGEHILSGVFYDLYGGVNRGFHMGEEYMTIDISLEDKPEYAKSELTWEMALAAEDRTNEIIWQDLPVVPHHFDTKAEAEKMPLRKKLTIEKDITIVTIGDPTKPADSVACCGTHPDTTGQVGLLKILKLEPNKGMFRVFFDAGKRAMEGYKSRFDILSKLEKDLSAGTPDILSKYAAKQERNKEIRDRLYRLTKAVKEAEVARIKAFLASSDDSSNYSNLSDASPSSEIAGDSYFSYSILTIEDIIDIGKALEGNIPGILYLLHEPSNTLLLFSDIHDCGKLVKDNVSVFNGKGGGNKSFSRAIFTRRDDAEMFMDAMRKLLR